MPAEPCCPDFARANLCCLVKICLYGLPFQLPHPKRLRVRCGVAIQRRQALHNPCSDDQTRNQCWKFKFNTVNIRQPLRNCLRSLEFRVPAEPLIQYTGSALLAHAQQEHENMSCPLYVHVHANDVFAPNQLATCMTSSLVPRPFSLHAKKREVLKASMTSYPGSRKRACMVPHVNDIGLPLAR